MTSKFVMTTPDRSSKPFTPFGQRSSGATEIPKMLPLSATSAPYFFSASATAFSSFVQLAGMTNAAFNRSRWPMLGRFVFVLPDGAAK